MCYVLIGISNPWFQLLPLNRGGWGVVGVGVNGLNVHMRVCACVCSATLVRAREAHSCTVDLCLYVFMS